MNNAIASVIAVERAELLASGAWKKLSILFSRLLELVQVNQSWRQGMQGHWQTLPQQLRGAASSEISD